MVWGAIAGAVGSVAGSLLGGKQDEKMFAAQSKQQMLYIQNALKALAKARQQSQGQWMAAKDSISSFSERSIGDVESRMAGSGLTGSTIYGNMLRGSAGDTQRMMTQLRSDIAAEKYNQWADVANVWSGVQAGQPQYGAAEQWGKLGGMVGGGLGKWADSGFKWPWSSSGSPGIATGYTAQPDASFTPQQVQAV
jgi:hypothetical protein